MCLECGCQNRIAAADSRAMYCCGSCGKNLASSVGRQGLGPDADRLIILGLWPLRVLLGIASFGFPLYVIYSILIGRR